MRPGSEVLSEGDTLGRPAIIVEGWAARVRLFGDGRRQILSFVLPGDIIGLAGRPGARAPSPVVALTQLVLARLPLLRGVFGRDENDPLAQTAHAVLRKEEAYLIQQIVRLGRQSAYERMAHLLLEFQHRLARADPVERDGFHLPLSQEILADAVGLSVVHTNRILQQLRRDNLIETRGSWVRLCDPHALAVLADWAAAI